jgi:hypothetical protein
MEADPEVLEIDRMEDELGALDDDASSIRQLISTLELCHHKAESWVGNVIEAIGQGQTVKGLGTRDPGQRHPVEQVWQNACGALSAWCAGAPAGSIELSIGHARASDLLATLGERTPLKEWQVQRIVEKIRSVLDWSRSPNDPASEYVWILLSGGEYDSAFRTDCPENYREHEDFWLATVRTILHDITDGRQAELSLGLAIDMLWPCHWQFVQNLRAVLAAIGGMLTLQEPFAACGRNISLSPLRNRMDTVCNALQAFCRDTRSDEHVDRQVLAQLGEPTPVRKWLAASLDKTIRLQINPPAAMRELAALAGPDWIRS